MDTPKPNLIDPKRMIAEVSIEELNRHSDDYYKKLLLPEFQLGKPFSMPMEAPQHLVRLGLILEELKLGPGTRVLDFGAGTCWISKALWQMGCDVTGVDVSEEALRLGRRLFEDYPVPMRKKGDWRLKRFDGRRLPLEDGSVDRIVCYDTFHHVPNQEQVVSEFYRVLAEGGVIALNEPMGEHSSTEASQREMRDYNVLENDLDLGELQALFNRLGFAGPKIKAATTQDLTLSLDEWRQVGDRQLPVKLIDSLSDFTRESAIFFFQKGTPLLDSRHSEGLSHSMTIERTAFSAKVHQPVYLNLTVTNTGRSVWLHGTGTDTGIVNVGTQEVDPLTKRFIAEHARFHLERDVHPGETIEMKIHILARTPGRHLLRLDLVSELVCWFRDKGSQPIFLEVEAEA